ncbi:HNH endonuclease [Halosquirtibacter xylanolyticus]|uniref:HNH endonuclease n=1 Tax=Halosquirtibacter xylanolyticus TaxID=3374599 RepID=UPI003747A32B|nr:HNH endonuclease [Prolixibacteraceae bacterium]
MYDGCKIELALDSKKGFASLDSIGSHSELTGEVLPLPSTAKEQGCYFIKQPNKYHNTKHYFQGSLHKYHNGGFQNHDDFSIDKVKATIDDITDRYKVDPTKSKIINLEFGVNILLPPGMNAQSFQKYLVSISNRGFDKLNRRNVRIGYIAEFSEFNLKIYDKGLQGMTGEKNRLRVEIKVMRTRWLDQFGIIKSGDDLVLSDLLNPYNISILGEVLVNKVQLLVLLPRDIDTKQLTPKERLTYVECRDARSWEDWDSKTRTRKKSQLDKIFQKVGQKNPVETLSQLIRTKWGELSTVCDDSLSTLEIDQCEVEDHSKQEPSTNSTEIIQNGNKGDKKATISNIDEVGYRTFLLTVLIYTDCIYFIEQRIRGPPGCSCHPPIFLKEVMKHSEEPIWCKMYREKYIKPKQKERQKRGWTKESQQGFYVSKAWRTLRNAFIQEHPICVRCEKRGIVREGNVVDHIIPVCDDASLSLDWNNLQTLCHWHHRHKTGEDQRHRNRSKLIKSGKQIMEELKQR